MKQKELMKLDKDFIVTESESFKEVFYAVDKAGKGIHVIVKGKSFGIDAENVLGFAQELVDIWDTLNPRGGVT